MWRWASIVVVLGAWAGCGRPPGVALPVAGPGTGRAAFAEAVQLFQAERFTEAVLMLQPLSRSYPELEDYQLYFLGVALERTQRPAEAAQLLRRLLEAHPRSVWRDEAALALGRTEALEGDITAANRALREAADGWDRTVALEARLQLARLDIGAGNAAAAAAMLQQLRRDAPGEDVAVRAKAELRRLRADHPEIAPTGSLLVEELRILLSERDLRTASTLASDLLDRASADQRSELLLLQAGALKGLGRADEAVAALRSAARLESGSMAATIEFRLASLLWNLDRDEEALSAFTDLRRRYPRSGYGPEALYAIGRIHEGGERFDRAIATYEKLANMQPSSRLGRESLWRIGWIEYRRGRWAAAERGFAMVAAHCRKAENCLDGLYWQARVRERGGRRSAAQLYRRIVSVAPASYYAMWAERRLGISSDPAPASVAPLVPELASLPPASDYHLQRAHELKIVGLPSMSRRELGAYEREQASNPAELRRLLQWYPAVDGHGAALRLAGRLGPRAGLDPESRQRVLYPLGYWETIHVTTEEVARGSGVGATPASNPSSNIDPLLVAALIRQESLYDPEARSPANACGLMQLLPSTASRVAGAPVTITELYDARRNIGLGTRYLSELLARYHGDRLKALAAYNAGEAAVDKWERRHAGEEPDEFVELISFRETRDYVKKVVTSYRQYQRLYLKPIPAREACVGSGGTVLSHSRSATQAAQTLCG